jgi:hypothetical protein
MKLAAIKLGNPDEHLAVGSRVELVSTKNGKFVSEAMQRT